MSLYVVSLISPFFLSLRRSRCSFPSLDNVGSQLRLLNFELSVMRFRMLSSYVALSKTTTPFPLSGLRMTMTIRLRTYSVPKMLFPNYHDPVLFINFLAQAVVPVMSAKQTDILLHVFVNISLLIRTRISFSTLMGQKHADLYARRIVFQSLTPPPHLSN